MTRTYRKSGEYFYVVSDTTIPMGSSGSRTMYGISIIGEHERASVKRLFGFLQFQNHSIQT